MFSFEKLICLGSLVFSTILVLVNSAIVANATTAITTSTFVELEKKLTSVSHLSEVRTTDWAFQALQSLAQRYDCISDSKIYEGNRVLTRYQFAMNLNACLNSINQVIEAGINNLVNQDDLSTLRRLQAEFALELATFQRQVDNLQVRTDGLEAQQFSTTTKLSGEAIFALTGFTGGNKADDSSEPINDNFVFSQRVRLNFDTSFTGEDRFRVRLQARSIPRLDRVTGTAMARLGFEGDTDNEFEISRLEYRFPIGQQARVYIEATGGELSDFADTLNPYFSSSSRGAISRFGRRNPIYRQSFGAGLGIDYEFSDAVSLGIGYVADNAEEPESGVSKSPDGAIVQLTLEPIEDAEIGLTYVRSDNNINTGTGSELANDPFDNDSDRISANSYGVQGTWRLSRRFNLGGWVGFTQATAEDLSGKPTANIFNYAITLAFLDLGKEGDLAGVVIGQPPKVINNEYGRKFTDEATSWHLEVFYRFQAADNIEITPGLLVITNPEHKHNSDTIFVGTVRTTFSF
ncbi:MAG: iron uptake porin [Chlorogloeopsis fritschii C42_A2020_084]|uniref:iron uptake porin n=1 Tax=Chlorogloeopsis fritschii TaxID=1124 RepID=UPI001A0C015A|nr:iron uptake porin [Chlorogloeopsis fritschii]MBF2008942.1 iron uptake porin [Chlorogloeopsis fritschii C42_A2020_084]